MTRYSRLNVENQKRENWNEIIDRWFDYFSSKFPILKNHRYIKDYILNMEVMPSMRTLMSAGDSLEDNNIVAYNCSYLSVNSFKAFEEALLILMCGAGVGFSVERCYTKNLKIGGIKKYTKDTNRYVIGDSKYGWQEALGYVFYRLLEGRIPNLDYSLIRPKGALLKTLGGRASGHEVLEDLFEFIIKRVMDNKKGYLEPIECHDFMCKIASIVVVGGVRRSAMISLSDLDDPRMRDAKSGKWYDSKDTKIRSNANNSACYNTTPNYYEFLDEWNSLRMSGSGERGIFNRTSIKKDDLNRDMNYRFGTNPCGEIILRDREFCNLTEVVIREYDTKETIKDKIRVATIIGTLQSSLDHFKGLDPIWKKNAEEERLLGVSMTGIYDNEFMSNPSNELRGFLYDSRMYTRDINSKWVKLLNNQRIAGTNDYYNIVPSKSITTIKPSGTVSELVKCAWGIHPRYAEHYIRRVRFNRQDPFLNWLESKKVYSEIDLQDASKRTALIPFFMKSPRAAKTRDNVSSVEHFDLCLLYKKYWTDHNPSVTINIEEDKWDEIGIKVLDNFSFICGMSFLPKDNTIYGQSPYEKISKEEYEKMKDSLPNLNTDDYRENIEFEKGSEFCDSGHCN